MTETNLSDQSRAEVDQPMPSTASQQTQPDLEQIVSEIAALRQTSERDYRHCLSFLAAVHTAESSH